MNENRTEIKYRNNGFIGQGILYLVLILISLTVLLLPMLLSGIGSFAVFFYIIGGMAIAVSGYLFVNLLVANSKPKNALVLEKNGFYDFINVGPGILIEWTNIATCNISGERLNINLENSDIVIAKMRRAEADDMRANIEDGYPAIVIFQDEIDVSIADLKEKIDSFIAASRTVEDGVPKKSKANPFSSDDVLRAFGKLPSDEKRKSSKNKKEEDSRRKYISPGDDFYAALQEVQKMNAGAALANGQEVCASEDLTKTIIAPQKSESDIKKRPVEPIETEMPEEIKKILSEAHSEKISQIEKMLSDNSESLQVKAYKENSEPLTLAALTEDDISESTEASEFVPEDSAPDINATEICEKAVFDDKQDFFIPNIDFDINDASDKVERLNATNEQYPEIVIIQSESKKMDKSKKKKDSLPDDTDGFILIDF